MIPLLYLRIYETNSRNVVFIFFLLMGLTMFPFIACTFFSYPEAAEEDIKRYERSFKKIPPVHKVLFDLFRFFFFCGERKRVNI